MKTVLRKNNRKPAFLLLLITVVLCLIPLVCHMARPAHAKVHTWEKQTALTADEKQIAQAVDEFFQSKVRSTGLNASVLVSRHGKILYSNQFGYSVYSSRKITDTTAFQLASISKTITATAVLQLAERGRIDLSRPVQEYINDFPYEAITVEMLLTHRSGLMNYIYLLDTINKSNSASWSTEEVLDYFIMNKPPLQASPGKKFQYCNTNYVILAHLVATVSRKSFPQYLQENIFQPAHMYHSFAATMYGDSLLPFQTKGYSGKKWTPAAYQPYDAVEGDKGIFASAYDLFLFDQALNHELLLKKETLNEAYAGYSFEKPGLKNYGLGWRLRTLPDSSKLIYHNGWWGGYTTSFLRVPEENISIIVLCNKYNKSTYLLNPLLQILGILPGDEMND